MGPFAIALLAVGGAVALWLNREAIAGAAGELKTPARPEPKTPDEARALEAFEKRQAIREYNALLGRTSPDEPHQSVCVACAAAGKGRRRKTRHDLIRRAQNTAAGESDPQKRQQVLAACDRLSRDMDRVEDARLAQHTYIANEESPDQPDFLQSMRDQAPPGFKKASLDDVAEDFGVSPDRLKDIVDSKDNPTQKIMIYERDVEALGPGPKYTVAFRGSTMDRRDWNNNGRNEAGFESPHQKNAARLGELLEEGAASQGKPIDSMVSATGHSKGGSEAQAFAAASGASARIFNPAGFDPSQYQATRDVRPEDMRVDRTSVINRNAQGGVNESGTDPLYYAQHEGVGRFVMKKPVTTGPARELTPIDPNLSVPSEMQSDTEPHSMVQVIEALERDKKSDEAMLSDFAATE